MRVGRIAYTLSLLASTKAAVFRPQSPDVALVGAKEFHVKCNKSDKKDPVKAGGSYGKDKCRCVGIENLRGYFAANLDFHHVQYPVETGASCSNWEKGVHPECSSEPMPGWCRESWCYVDPCQCDLDVAPKKTVIGTTYQGQPAYFSYATCSGFDFWTKDKNPKACILQKDAVSCAKAPDCSWDGAQCRGTDVANGCSKSQSAAAEYGQPGCRCVGLGGHVNGKSIRYISNSEEADYNSNVGSSCAAWEMDTHPDCKKAGVKPEWCSQKWCFVDPCTCNSGTPPKAVMMANAYERFQGKVAYFSYETCGGMDMWSTSVAVKGEYCHTRMTEASCETVKKCRWTGEKCLGQALAETCAKQKDTGILGMDATFEQDGASSFGPLAGLSILIGLLVGV